MIWTGVSVSRGREHHWEVLKRQRWFEGGQMLLMQPEHRVKTAVISSPGRAWPPWPPAAVPAGRASFEQSLRAAAASRALPPSASGVTDKSGSCTTECVMDQ